MKVGDKWNGWTAESFIGEGSYGKVYKIVREEFGHKYESALKIIRIPQNSSEISAARNEGMDDESVTSYFRSKAEEIVSEFAIMSELRGNSNIVSYEDHSCEEDEGGFGWTIYIRMEMLKPLYTYIKEHPFRTSDVIRLGIDICKALEICKTYGLIHRDIKPENIFVSKFGDFKLGDFGIARRFDGVTISMTRQGTYSYMAPEVYKGEPYNSTVDTYSLGLVLYRLLNCSRLPFMPPYPDKIEYSDRDRAVNLRFAGEELPPPCKAGRQMTDIILKACSYDPDYRYDDPADMRKDLEAALRSEKKDDLIFPEETADNSKGGDDKRRGLETEYEATSDSETILIAGGMAAARQNRGDGAEDRTDEKAGSLPESHAEAAETKTAVEDRAGSADSAASVKSVSPAKEVKSTGMTRSKKLIIIGACAAAVLVILTAAYTMITGRLPWVKTPQFDALYYDGYYDPASGTMISAREIYTALDYNHYDDEVEDVTWLIQPEVLAEGYDEAAVSAKMNELFQAYQNYYSNIIEEVVENADSISCSFTGVSGSYLTLNKTESTIVINTDKETKALLNPIKSIDISHDIYDLKTSAESEGFTADYDEVKERLKNNPLTVLTQPELPAEEIMSEYPYETDKEYTLQENLRVRDGASDKARWKKRSELTGDAKKHALKGKKAVLKKGTKVTCLEVNGDWMKIPSGWICCREGDKVYVK